MTRGALSALGRRVANLAAVAAKCLVGDVEVAVLDNVVFLGAFEIPVLGLVRLKQNLWSRGNKRLALDPRGECNAIRDVLRNLLRSFDQRLPRVVRHMGNLGDFRDGHLDIFVVHRNKAREGKQIVAW